MAIVTAMKMKDRATGRRAERSSPGNDPRHTVNKKKAWTRKGVSDIIGNLLILAITVTLFSSILYFVTSMPGPAEKVYTDINPNLDFNPDTGDAYVNLTHKGGNTLVDYKTAIYLFVQNVPESLNLTKGGITSGQWSTGMTWSYKLTGVTMSTAISVMIVDLEANTIVYQTPLLGGSQAAMALPIIGDRGMDPSPTGDGDKIEFYAVIFDPYGTLNRSSVTLNANSIGKGNITLTYSGNNEFRSSTYTASTTWNNAIVYVNAKDQDGTSLQARLTLKVTTASGGGGGGGSPYDDYPQSWVGGTYPPNASGGNSGGSLGITFYFIRNEHGEITREFSPGEQVTIELWSDALKNLAYSNTVNVILPLTGLADPASTNAFKGEQTTVTGFYKYIYNFTAPSLSYRYTLEMLLMDSTGKSANIADYIDVGGKDYPSISTYRLDAANGTLIKTTKFNHTDTVYLIINTRDVDLSAETALLGDLQIRDFSGTYVVQKSAVPYTSTPTYDRPMSSLFKTDGVHSAPIITAGGKYTLYLVLYEANQGWWLAGTNTYTLKINTFEDTGNEGLSYGETYSSISCQFEVTAPRTTTDILASLGKGTFTWSASGATWSENSIVWYQGGDQWDVTTIDGAPGKGSLALAIYDINGDGRDDVIVGSQDATKPNLVWYENEKIDGSQWSIRTIASSFDAYSGKNAATTSQSYGGRSWTGSTDTGNANEDATLWSAHDHVNMFVTKYSGTEYVCQNELVSSIAIADLDGDGDSEVIASFIHVVIYSTAESADEAGPSNSWGMFFNRGIYIFWNDGKWTKTTLSGTNDWITNDAANKDSNPSAGDIAVGDLNQDGYPDIVAVYQDGTTKVWINQWPALSGSGSVRQTGAFNSSPMVLSGTTLGVGGYLPWKHSTASQYQPLVEIADMDGDGYPDIVRTSTLDNNIYILYTKLTGSDLQTRSPGIEFRIDTNSVSTIVGSKANLAAADGVYESLTEAYVTYGNQTLHAGSAIGDTTGSTLTNTYYNDDQYYAVNTGTVMRLSGFAPSSDYASKTVSKATLQVSWKADSSYAGTAWLQYSTDSGGTWHNTTFKPTSGDMGSIQIDLLVLGVDSWAKLNSLRIQLVNPAGPGGSVSFDHIGLDAQFVQTCVLGWQWEIPNVHRAYHELTMVAHVSGTEKFRIQYSMDNETWFEAFVVDSTTDVTYSKLLPYTSNSYYYIRAVDDNNGTTDGAKDTLSIDMLVINHYTQTVEWDAKNSVTNFKSSDPAITAMTIGDISKSTYGSMKDIVFSTAKTTDNKALYIATQYSTKSFEVKAVVTTLLGASCSDSMYDTRAVQLGDVDGDGDLDIVLVVGFAYGQQGGTAPTLWVYYNNQQLDSNGRWAFYEDAVNELGAWSAINVQLGNIDLAIFLPLVGVVGIVAANVAVERMSRRRKT